MNWPEFRGIGKGTLYSFSPPLGTSLVYTLYSSKANNFQFFRLQLEVKTFVASECLTSSLPLLSYSTQPLKAWLVALPVNIKFIIAWWVVGNREIVIHNHKWLKFDVCLTLSVPVVLLNSPNLSLYFSLSLKEFCFWFSAVCFVWSILVFLFPNVLFGMWYVRRSWVLITDWDWKG